MQQPQDVTPQKPRNVKPILGILAVLVAGAVGGYLFFSKPGVRMPPQPAVPTPRQTPLTPQAGNTITIRNCKADPQILQVDEGANISFVNADSEARMLTFFDPESQGPIDLNIAAGETAQATRFSTPRNFTNNFSCDQKTLPYGGAIYVMP